MQTDTFQKIGIIGQQPLPQVKETVYEICCFLLAQGYGVIVETDTSAHLDSLEIRVLSAAELVNTCDLLIVVGGDGSLLRAARYAITKNIPILGINRGHLGFLVDVPPDQFKTILSDILFGHYFVEERLLLEASIYQGTECIYQEIAVNDIVLKQGDIPSMLAFDVHIDGHCIAEERADGLIIATPTGSTAYALSGGGPILHPALDAYLLLSMFSHTLSNRPIVIPKSSTTKIKLKEHHVAKASFRCDGCDIFHITAEHDIIIKSSPKELRLVHSLSYNYFKNLRHKLGWGQNVINKE